MLASPPAWICLCAAADLLAAAFSAPWKRSWFWSICDICAAASQDLGCSSPAAASFQWLAPFFVCVDLDVDGVSLETVRASCGSFAFRGGNLLLNAVSSRGNFACAPCYSVPTLVLLWIESKAGRNVFYKLSCSCSFSYRFWCLTLVGVHVKWQTGSWLCYISVQSFRWPAQLLRCSGFFGL